MLVSPRARSLWRSVRLLQQRPRDNRGELISDDDALILRGVLRELALELGVSPLVEPHRAGAAPWKWIAAGDGEQMARRQLSRDLAGRARPGARARADKGCSRVSTDALASESVIAASGKAGAVW